MKKLDLGGIQPASKSARPTHPTIDFCDAQADALVEQWATINPQFKTLKNQIDTLRVQIAPHIKAAYFTKYLGLAPDSSTLLTASGGRTVKLITKNAYSKTLDDDKELIAAIGTEATAKHFRWVTILKAELDKLPEEMQEPFALAIIKLAQEMGGTAAISHSQCIQPRAGFHEARTSLFTVAQNMAIDAILPITAYPQL